MHQCQGLFLVEDVTHTLAKTYKKPNFPRAIWHRSDLGNNNVLCAKKERVIGSILDDNNCVWPALHYRLTIAVSFLSIVVAVLGIFGLVLVTTALGLGILSLVVVVWGTRTRSGA